MVTAVVVTVVVIAVVRFWGVITVLPDNVIVVTLSLHPAITPATVSIASSNVMSLIDFIRISFLKLMIDLKPPTHLQYNKRMRKYQPLFVYIAKFCNINKRFVSMT